jgi:hypothetical protein
VIARRVRVVQAAVIVAVAGIIVRSIWWTRPTRPASPLPSPAPAVTALNGSLLPQMDGTRSPDEPDLSGPIPTTEQLEKQFSVIVQNQERVNELKTHAARAMATKNTAAVKRDFEEAEPLVSLLNLRDAAFERDLAAARQARPKDSTVQWLTGELQ